MKFLVNGCEQDLSPCGAQVTGEQELLYVRLNGLCKTAVAIRDGDRFLISYAGRAFVLERPSFTSQKTDELASGELRAPMPGLIASVEVELGASVAAGEVVVVIEAMKTHQPLAAPFDGRVKEIHVSPGEVVKEGSILAILVKVAEKI